MKLTLVIAVLCTLAFDIAVSQPTASFLVDYTKSTNWDHIWERCVGSGHAALALREDYRQQLTQARKELGFQYVRFHGVLDDDLSVFLPYFDYYTNTTYMYSFADVDSIYDFLLEIGMKPVVELSFMPMAIANGTSTVFHYQDSNNNPPRNITQWTELIYAFADHLVQRYGPAEVESWYFEVWNEPNCGFWTGTIEEYFHFYAATSAAIKSVDPNLQVGGPATCQSGYIQEFLDFCATYNASVDFVSTHFYPTDYYPNLPRNIMQNVTAHVRSIVGASMPLLYTEYNSGLFPSFQPAQHDTPYAAAFVIANVANISQNVDMFSYWTFSDIFEEQGFISVPFHGGSADGYGMMNIYGVPKPAWRAFELLHQTGITRFMETLEGVSEPLAEVPCQVLVTDSADDVSTVVLLITNWQVFGVSTPSDWTVNVTVTNLPHGTSIPAMAELRRIDENNANPLAAWLGMGAPAYPNKHQIDEMMRSSQMKKTTVPVYTSVLGEMANPSFTVSVSLPPYAVAEVRVKLNV